VKFCWSGQAVTSNSLAEPGKLHDADNLTRASCLPKIGQNGQTSAVRIRLPRFSAGRLRKHSRASGGIGCRSHLPVVICVPPIRRLNGWIIRERGCGNRCPGNERLGGAYQLDCMIEGEIVGGFIEQPQSAGRRVARQFGQANLLVHQQASSRLLLKLRGKPRVNPRSPGERMARVPFGAKMLIAADDV